MEKSSDQVEVNDDRAQDISDQSISTNHVVNVYLVKINIRL